MMVILFLGGVAGIIAVQEWVTHKKSQSSSQKKQLGRSMHKHVRILPHALSMLIVVAHVSELTRVVEHVDWQHMVAALLLLGVWISTGAGATGHEA
jgi:hypothetical protein